MRKNERDKGAPREGASRENLLGMPRMPEARSPGRAHEAGMSPSPDASMKNLYRELDLKNILLVGDDPWTRETLSFFFQIQGCRLESAAGAREGMAIPGVFISNNMGQAGPDCDAALQRTTHVLRAIRRGQPVRPGRSGTRREYPSARASGFRPRRIPPTADRRSHRR